MYRHLFIIAVLLLTLTACNKEKTPQVEQEAQAQSTSLSHAIATQPVVQPAETHQAEVAVAQAETAVTAPVVVPVEETAVVVEQPIENTEGTAETAITYTTSIVSVELDNKFGPVLIPHRLHVELYDCATCHGPGTPGKIDKTKKQFHSLCRGCHAKEQSGPTKCGSCHNRH